MTERGWWVAWRGFRVRGWCSPYLIEGGRTRYDCAVHEVRLGPGWSSRQEAADVLLHIDEGLATRVRVGDVVELSHLDSLRVLRAFEDEIEEAFVQNEESK